MKKMVKSKWKKEGTGYKENTEIYDIIKKKRKEKKQEEKRGDKKATKEKAKNIKKINL